MTTVSNQELASFFHDLNFRFDTLAELDSDLANRFNVFRWLSRELTLSSIIRELLDPMGSHGQDDAFLKIFLDKIGLSHLDIVRNAGRPKCEEFTSCGRRIDIVLRPDNHCAIGIENKPRAADQPGWVKDYSEHLARCGNSYLLIYLTTDGRGPSDGEKEAADKLGSKFRRISYKKDIKDWLVACCQACRADKVRSFLKDFINYVNVMEETGMLSEQDLALVMNYVRDQPRGKGFRIAYAVKHAWPEVVRRVASDFMAGLEKRLAVDFGDGWSVTPVPNEKLLKRWSEFKVSKVQWGGRFAFGLCFEEDGCAGLTFGVYKRDELEPHIRDFKLEMDKSTRKTGINRSDWLHWEWVLPLDEQYMNWNDPDTLKKLAEKNDALDYFAGWFRRMRETAEPLIDSACSAS
jgi:PD-(D/E)XK nuclease superfamily protein